MNISKALICFLSIILIGGIGLLSIPSFAYAPNGVELVPIELTNDMIKAMFDNGDVTAFIDIWSSTGLQFNLYDMTGQTKSTITTPTTESSALRYLLNNCQVYTGSGYSRINFYTDLSFSQRSDNGNFYVKVVIDLPFNYYIEDFDLLYYTYYSGLSNDQNTELGVSFVNSDHVNNQSVTVNGSRLVGNWSALGPVTRWFNKYNWVPEGYDYNSNLSEPIRTCYSSYNITNVTDSRLIESIILIHHVSTIRASGSGTGYNYFFCAPMLVCMDFTNTVYVEPDIADTVEEYLDLIAGPTTPTQQARINELKDKFDDTLDDLDGAKENIHKDMPDLPSVSDLPQEAIEGMEDASEYVINPFLTIGIVSTLLGVSFIFTVLKILLYGSGPY